MVRGYGILRENNLECVIRNIASIGRSLVLAGKRFEIRVVACEKERGERKKWWQFSGRWFEVFRGIS